MDLLSKLSKQRQKEKKKHEMALYSSSGITEVCNIPNWFENMLFAPFLRRKSVGEHHVWSWCTSLTVCQQCRSLYKSVWVLGASRDLDYIWRAVQSHLLSFKTKSPSTSVVSANAVALFCYEAPEMFSGLQHFIWLNSMGGWWADDDWSLILGELIL